MLRKNLLIAIVALFAVSAAEAHAAAPNLEQPLSITWTKGFKPAAFYQYGQKLNYRFTVTNDSDQTVFISVNVNEYVIPAKIAPSKTRYLRYKLNPHQSLPILHQAYAPDGAVFADSTFGFSAAAQMEGHPSVWLGSYAWHDK
jgi:hypothetical protein